MIMVKEGIQVLNVRMGKENSEILSVQIKLRNGIKQRIVVAYVPPKTNTWTKEKYEELLTCTIRTLKEEIKEHDNVLLAGDFNCKEVNWDDFEAGGTENNWGRRLLETMEENFMTQWVKENTRLRGSDEPARLDLIFTKGNDLKCNVRHKCPLGKSDHEILEFEVKCEIEKEPIEVHKENRRNYFKVDYKKSKAYFKNAD